MRTRIRTHVIARHEAIQAQHEDPQSAFPFAVSFSFPKQTSAKQDEKNYQRANIQTEQPAIE